MALTQATEIFLGDHTSDLYGVIFTKAKLLKTDRVFTFGQGPQVAHLADKTGFNDSIYRI